LLHDHVSGVVCNPPPMHPEVMGAAAQAGKQICTEKVRAPTVEGCDRIIAAAGRAGVQLVVSIPQLCSGETRWAKEAIAPRRLGEIPFVHTRVWHGRSAKLRSTRHGRRRW